MRREQPEQSDPIVERVADAFVSGTRIAWHDAAVATASTADRCTIEQFEALSTLRGSNQTQIVESLDWRERSLGSATIIALVKVVLIVASAMWVAVTAAAVPHPPMFQVVVMSTFAAAALGLSSADDSESAARALGAIFAISAAAFARPLQAATLASSPFGPAEWLDRLGVYPEAFLAGAFWTFAARFPTVGQFSRFDAFARLIERLTWGLGLILFVCNVVLAVAPSFTLLQPLSRTDPGNTFWKIISAFIAAAIAVIACRTAVAPPGERRRVGRFAAALALTTGPFLLHAIVRVFSWRFDQWLRTASPHDRAWLDVTMLTGLGLLPLAAAAAVLSDRAMVVVVRRTTQYVLTRRVLMALTALPTLLLAGYVYRHRSESISDIVSGPPGRMLIGCLLAGTLSIVLNSRIRREIDQLFGIRASKPTSELRSALDRVRQSRDRREMEFTVTLELKRTLKASFAAILAEDETGRLRQTFGEPVSIPTDSALDAVLRVSEEHLDLTADSQLLMLLPLAERRWLTTVGICGLTPIRSRGTRATAAIAIGACPGALPVSVEDRWLLESIADLLAVARQTAVPPATDGIRRSLSDGIAEDLSAFECSACGITGSSHTLSCGCRASVEPAALPWRLNGKFELRRRIGRGGMGVVYLATDRELGRDVAIKALPRATAQAIDRLRSEARAMAMLAGSGLATIFGVEWWQNTPALVIEYCAAGTLADQLTRGPLSSRTALDISTSICEVLEELHARNYAHRDLKPSNIGFTDSGKLKLLDFGLAGLVTSDADRVGHATDSTARRASLAGTLRYLPPESLGGSDDPRRRDLWALSLVLLECLLGRHPLISDTIGDLRTEITVKLPVVLASPLVPIEVRELLARELNPDPAFRSTSVSELKRSLVEARPAVC